MDVLHTAGTTSGPIGDATAAFNRVMSDEATDAGTTGLPAVLDDAQRVALLAGADALLAATADPVPAG